MSKISREAHFNFFLKTDSSSETVFGGSLKTNCMTEQLFASKCSQTAKSVTLFWVTIFYVGPPLESIFLTTIYGLYEFNIQKYPKKLRFSIIENIYFTWLALTSFVILKVGCNEQSLLITPRCLGSVSRWLIHYATVPHPKYEV